MFIKELYNVHFGHKNNKITTGLLIRTIKSSDENPEVRFPG